MYSVSNDYLSKIASSSREVTWYGTITLTNGTVVNFDTSDIAQGGLSVSVDVSSDENPSIGNAFASELRLNLYTTIDRYALYGAEVVPYFRLYLTSSTYEDVPLGKFYVSEATRTANMVSMVCYDAMTKMDSVKVVEDLGETTPYAWIKFVVERAGLTLGNTSAEIGQMPNGSENIVFSQGNTTLADMTCRDALGYLCAVVCANAYIGRDGKVYVKEYGMTAVATIGTSGRYSSSFADYTTEYTAVSLSISSTGATEYYADSPDDGLTFDLGSNPWLQAGSTQGRETVCRAILGSLDDIAYVPYEVDIPARPELDIVDVLSFTGNQAASAIGAIVSISYSSSGSMTVKCTGANPRLMGVKTKTEKALEALTSTVAKEINQISVVQNSSAVSISEDTETSILTYNFEVTAEENTTMIDVSVALTATATETEQNDVYTLSDIVAQLSFYVDDTEISVYDPVFIIDEGKDTMTFNYSLSGLSVGAHEFDIRLEMDGGSGSIAVGDVHEMLWGYGITFEVYVKGIQVTYNPPIVFYPGQTLRYYGVGVDAVYNNGMLADVSNEATYDPAWGTAVTTDDIGTHTVSAEYEGFSDSFEIVVSDISMNLSAAINAGEYAAAPTIILEDGTARKIEGYPYLKLYDCTYDPDNQYKPSCALAEYYSPTYHGEPTTQEQSLIIDGTWICGNDVIVYNGNSWDRNIYDFETATFSKQAATIDFIDHQSATIQQMECLRTFAIDNHIVYAWLDVGYYENGNYYNANGYGIGELTGGVYTIHIHLGSYLSFDMNSGDSTFPVGKYVGHVLSKANFGKIGIDRYNETKYLAKYSGTDVTLAEVSVSNSHVLSITDLVTIPFGHTPNFIRVNYYEDIVIFGYSDANEMDMYFVDMSDFSHVHVTSDDPANNDFYKHVVGKNVIYHDGLKQYICKDYDSFSYRQTFYMSRDLVNWDSVELTPVSGGGWTYKLGEQIGYDPMGFWVTGRRNSDTGYRTLAFIVCYSLGD